MDDVQCAHCKKRGSFKGNTGWIIEYPHYGWDLILCSTDCQEKFWENYNRQKKIREEEKKKKENKTKVKNCSKCGLYAGYENGMCSTCNKK